MAASGKRSIRVLTVAMTLLGIGVAAACGSNGLPPQTGESGQGDASSPGSGSGSGGDDATSTFASPADANTSLSIDQFASCAATAQEATELPLDLYFMLDSSGSMNDLAAPLKSKWSSVVSAMTGFVNDAASAGIGVGLQYFPLRAAGVPASCTSSAQCPAATGPCLFKACDLSFFQQVMPCDTSTDCPGGHACNPIGECHNDVNTVCPTTATDCGTDANGFALGACDTLTSSTCTEGDSCNAQDYTTPAVPIALLPGSAAAVTASLMGHSPDGNTPTSQALVGAIDAARAYAVTHPSHSVVAVLATDGIPDECTPFDTAGIAQIAAAGLSGTPSIKTFLIGVFTPDDLATGTAALNQIAASGGTKQAFIIQSTQNVAQQFETALSAIRVASLPCQYEIPVPDSGTADLTNVNVEYTTGAGVASGLPYVESAAKCGTGSGWYYDVDPAEGGTPTAIFICPSTCSTLQSDTKGSVDVLVGCQTLTR